MILIPSVDILEGKTVRLYKGDFDKVTYYDVSPLDAVKSYADMGSTFVHIVNLDRAGGSISKATEDCIEQICTAIPHITIQMGGGLRDTESLAQANDLGITRFVLGTLAVKDIPMTKYLMAKYGTHRFTFAFDVQKKEGQFMVKTHGWQNSSSYTLSKMLDEYKDGSHHVLCTDIDRDGSLASPNFQLYADIKKQYPKLFVQASGGIHNEEDFLTLAHQGIDAVIVGKAIHEKKINLPEMIKCYS